MRYVSDASHRTALAMEDALRKLPPEAGVLFVSVAAEPAEGGDARKFRVFIGMARRFEEGTGSALVKHALSDFLEGRTAETLVFRGVLGACRDDHHASARPPAA